MQTNNRIINKNTARPTITAIVPAYNHENFIAVAIESLRTQTFAPFELIVIDDCSRDTTLEQARHATRNLSFSTQVLHNERNLGLCKTLNKALAMARGDYVMFLASDDSIPTDKLERQTQILSEHPEFVAVYADMVIMSPDGQHLRIDRSLTRELDVRPTNDLLEMNFVDVALGRSAAFIQSGLFRTTAVRAVGGFDEQLRVEDLDVTLRLLRHGRIAYECAVGANYRANPQGANRNFHALEADYETTLNKHRAHAQDLGIPWRKVEAANALRRANNRANSDEDAGAIAWSLVALARDPTLRAAYFTIARSMTPRFARQLAKRAIELIRPR